MGEPNGRSLPVGHILGLMTWQMEKQQAWLWFIHMRGLDKDQEEAAIDF